MAGPILQLDGLTVRYGDFVAVDGLDLPTRPVSRQQPGGGDLTNELLMFTLP